MTKTGREIELESEVAKGERIIGKLLNEGSRVIDENRKLKKKLEIAVKALEKIVDDEEFSSCLECPAYFYAVLALKEIEE